MAPDGPHHVPQKNGQMQWPDRVESLAQLEALLSEPTAAAIETFRELPGDLLILGVAGKMGPTLARMARAASDRAGHSRRIVGVARFSDARVAEELRQHHVEPWTADLLDRSALTRLPEMPLIVFMAGRKFGSTGDESRTWAMNTYLPALVADRFPHSRMVAFSTGNVYGDVSLTRGGSQEGDTPQPTGEYAMSCLGRERLLQEASQRNQTPMALIRLNYACELRYGVLVDLALKVFRARPIDLQTPAFNVLWQGDANAMALAALRDCTVPAVAINVTGPEQLRVRDVAEWFGRAFHKPPHFVGVEGERALLSNARPALERYGQPRVSPEQLMRWIADWIQTDGPRWEKPTHFESRDGQF